MNPTAAQHRSSDETTRQTVLIVDDTPQNLTILGELLQPTGSRAANSGERACAPRAWSRRPTSSCST